jgi:hypothetical protein
MEKRILGIYIGEKVSEPLQVQYLLTKYGCSIRTRLGLNDTLNEIKGGGIIILELTGESTECDRLEADLKKVEHLGVQKMIFLV